MGEGREVRASGSEHDGNGHDAGEGWEDALATAVDCQRCEEVAIFKAKEAGAPLSVQVMMRRFIVCSVCGNKRCPKATDHRLDCTNSNEVNQPGSDFYQYDNWPEVF